jgi:hypothetical protein
LTTQALQAGPARIRPGRLFIVGMLLTGGGLVVSVPMMLAGGSGSIGTSETAPAPATAPAPESQGSSSTTIPVGEVIPSVAASFTDGLSAGARALGASQQASATAPQDPAPAAPAHVPAQLPSGLGSILPAPAVGTSGVGDGLPLVGDLPIAGGLLGDGSPDSPLDGVGGLPVVSDLLPIAEALPIPAVDGLLGGDPLGGDLLGGDLLGGDLLGGGADGGLLGGGSDDSAEPGGGSAVAGLPIDGLIGGLLG